MPGTALVPGVPVGERQTLRENDTPIRSHVVGDQRIIDDTWRDFRCGFLVIKRYPGLEPLDSLCRISEVGPGQSAIG